MMSINNVEYAVGKHFLIELINCSAERLKFVNDVSALFLRAAEESQATILHHIFHQFEPVGVSGLILIAESHFSIHTWPEKQYAAAGIFTCGAQMNPQRAIEVIKAGFEAQETRVRIVKRGI
ncbi:MAG: adenosylmethionine decarboxylase [Deltaproteobacteria bacterium]|nr:adenosylmethionine decarboxylase [Deltaproteobacteria bacterium]